MTRRKPAIQVELTEGAVRVRHGDYSLTLKTHMPPADDVDAPDFIVSLDDIAFWDPPHEHEEIDIDLAPRICDAIERQCDEHGLSIEFD